MNEAKKACPEFPYWGASYPDVRCVNGTLQDLDYCDENGNLYDKGEGVPCPFCRTEEFIEFDPYSLMDYFIGEMEETGDTIANSIERLAKQQAREVYLDWIGKMKERYA